MKSMKRVDFRKIFREEWELYRHDHPSSGNKVQKTPLRRNVKFDSPVRAGEIRLFADVEPPRVGLVYKAWGESDWVVVPISDFSVPASDREAWVDNRVYQLWNAQTLSRETVARSWRVEKISGKACKTVGAFLLHSMIGDPIRDNLKQFTGLPIREIDSPECEYEQAFMLSSSDFIRVEYRCLPQSLPSDIFKRAVAVAFADGVPLAAADESRSSIVLFMEGKPNSSVMLDRVQTECTTAKQFISIQPEETPSTLVYVLKNVPDEWRNKSLEVSAYTRDSHKLLGDGEIDVGAGRIVIDKFDRVSTREKSIDSPGDIVLVVTDCAETMK